MIPQKYPETCLFGEVLFSWVLGLGFKGPLPPNNQMVSPKSVAARTWKRQLSFRSAVGLQKQVQGPSEIKTCMALEGWSMIMRDSAPAYPSLGLKV